MVTWSFALFQNTMTLSVRSVRFCALVLCLLPIVHGLKHQARDNGFDEHHDSGKLYRIYSITKTRLYNFDPLKPHFYIVKLGLPAVYIIFLILLETIDCGYSLEPPRRGGSNEYPQSMFWAEIWKISELFIWKFSVFGSEIFNIFE